MEIQDQRKSIWKVIWNIGWYVVGVNIFIFFLGTGLGIGNSPIGSIALFIVSFIAVYFAIKWGIEKSIQKGIVDASKVFRISLAIGLLPVIISSAFSLWDIYEAGTGVISGTATLLYAFYAPRIIADFFQSFWGGIFGAVVTFILLNKALFGSARFSARTLSKLFVIVILLLLANFIGAAILIKAFSFRYSEALKEETTVSQNLTIEALKNANYTSVHGGNIKLTDGEFEGVPPGQGTLKIVVFFGGASFGDLDGDGREDAVVTLLSTFGIGGFQEIAVMMNENGKPAYRAGIDFGYSTGVKSVAIEKGEILIDLLEPSPSDPACCPTVQTVRRYNLFGNQLEEIADETADWKTYRNEEFGFEIKYPQEWTLDLSKAFSIHFDIHNNNHLAKEEYEARYGGPQQGIYYDNRYSDDIEINIFPSVASLPDSSEGLSLQKWIDERRKSYSIGYQKEIRIGAYDEKYKGIEVQELGLTQYRSIFLEHNTIIYNFSIREGHPKMALFDQMLSTFQFLK